ncbi:hypothetical protein ACOSQ2_005997 [Xanthoceras sorbifolium]
MICLTSRTNCQLHSFNYYKSFEIHFQLYLHKIMGFRLPLIVQAMKLLRHSSFTASQSCTLAADVPKGHLAVYVGESQRKRFVIPLPFVNLFFVPRPTTSS